MSAEEPMPVCEASCGFTTLEAAERSYFETMVRLAANAKEDDNA